MLLSSLNEREPLALTLKELRLRFYLRVLEEGTVQTGDTWHLHDRLHPEANLVRFNRCFFQTFDPAFARELIALPDLEPYWKERLTEKLAAHPL